MEIIILYASGQNGTRSKYQLPVPQVLPPDQLPVRFHEEEAESFGKHRPEESIQAKETTDYARENRESS